MSRSIDLGVLVGTGRPFRGDLDIILRSNALVQANSGGGKSWLLRRMIEQSFGRVPQIVIDPEGEFSTLRQKFDLVLVGKGGDTPADVRSAQLLAHRLLELGTSAVVDLFEMSKSQRPVWVAAFVQALVDAPKTLWRDLLLYVDEAHELAPEAGHGAHESGAEKMCRHALIDVAAKGRKRGYGVVAATQRLGKLSKDFAAELKNVLIGQTFIDIDRERAAGSLGIAKTDKAKFFADVKTLQPGAFYSLGRAFTLEPTLVEIGKVQTEHPEAGRRQSAPPPPTEKIRHLLPQLADLPKEAETKLQTEKELKARVAELERELARRPTPAAPAPAAKVVVEQPLIQPSDLVRLEQLVIELRASEEVFASRLEGDHGLLVETLEEFVAKTDAQRAAVAKLQGDLTASLSDLARRASTKPTPRAVPATPVTASRPATAAARPRPGAEQEGLTKCARALLSVIVQRGAASVSQVSALSGYRKTSSSFDKGLSELRVKGLISGTRDRLTSTDAGREVSGPTETLPAGRALLDYWLSRLSRAEGAVLKVVYDTGTVTRAEIAERSGYSATSSSFDKALSGLRVLDLIHGPRSGDVSIAEVFTDGAARG